jgi:glycosyltransferase involved in cell wall biosynthesis
MSVEQAARSTTNRSTVATGPLVLFGNVPFATSWQRSQQLALCLATHRDVVYVDPNRSFLQGLRRRAAPGPTPEVLPPRLSLYRPDLGLPFARSVCLLNRANCGRTVTGLLRHLEAHGWQRPGAVIASFPDHLDSVRLFDGVPLVYDLMDEPELFLRWWQKRRFRRMHGELLERADLVVTSSRVLLERYGGRARRTVCVTNGVRESLLHDLPRAEPHAELARLPRPRFGYVGMIAHWFDFEAVAALARAFPRGSVVLVGPSDVRVPRLPDNVVRPGPVPHLQLAPVLRAFDVGLIPFRRCAAIDAVNPVKLYEYLAAGLPVLSSRFDEVAAFDSLLSLYDTPAAAVAAARSLLARPLDGDERRRRAAFAARNCWTAKAEQFLQAIALLRSP